MHLIPYRLRKSGEALEMHLSPCHLRKRDATPCLCPFESGHSDGTGQPR